MPVYRDAALRLVPPLAREELSAQLAGGQDGQRRHGQPKERVLPRHLVPDSEQRPVHQPQDISVRQLVLESQDFRRERGLRVVHRQGSKPPGTDGASMTTEGIRWLYGIVGFLIGAAMAGVIGRLG